MTCHRLFPSSAIFGQDLENNIPVLQIICHKISCNLSIQQVSWDPPSVSVLAIPRALCRCSPLLSIDNKCLKSYSSPDFSRVPHQFCLFLPAPPAGQLGLPISKKKVSVPFFFRPRHPPTSPRLNCPHSPQGQLGPPVRHQKSSLPQEGHL